MVQTIKFALLIMSAAGMLYASASVAHADDDRNSGAVSEEDKGDAKKAGRIIGKIIAGDADELWERKVYRGRVIYEDEDMKIRRGYDKHGRRHIIKEDK